MDAVKHDFPDDDNDKRTLMPKIIWKTPAEMGWVLCTDNLDTRYQVWVDENGMKRQLQKNATIAVMAGELRHE